MIIKAIDKMPYADHRFTASYAYTPEVPAAEI